MFGVNLADIESNPTKGMDLWQFNAQSEKNFYPDGSYDYETDFRPYDEVLGRFRSVDLLTSKYPSISGYGFAFNNPVNFNDPTGLEGVLPFGMLNRSIANFAAQSGYAMAIVPSVANKVLAGVAINLGTSLISNAIGNNTTIQAQSDKSYYQHQLNERLQNPKLRAMIIGVSSVGNAYYGDRINPMGILQLTENQKQAIFRRDIKKSIAILFSEFIEGHGLEDRSFDASMPITKQISSAPVTKYFYDYFYKLYRKNMFKEGVLYRKLMLNSPDNAPSTEQWVTQLMTGFTNKTSFWTGSLEYNFYVRNNTLFIRADNNYTIASGVTRNDNDNLIRIKGLRSPLGNTYQRFNFSISIKTLQNYYEK